MLVRSKQIPFGNKSLYFSLSLLFIQQLVVASSTIWITQLIIQIQEGNFSYPLLGAYLLSLIFPYFPGSMALVAMTKAKYIANIDFINNFSLTYKGKVTEWTNLSCHSKVSSILSGESQKTINSYFDYFYRFFACGINVGLNLLVLALIMEPLLIVSYALGVLLSFIVLKIQSKRKKVLALKAQQGNIKWTSMLLKAWDNVLLDNSYNFGLWVHKTKFRGQRFLASGVKLEVLSQGVSILMAFLLLAPTFFLLCLLPIIYNYDLSKMAVMVVALPRLFQVLSYSYEMLFILADFPAQTNRLQTILKLLNFSSVNDSEGKHNQLDERIEWNKIKVTNNDMKIDPKTFLTSFPSKGRYTIRGENGSGKSSFLLMVKAMKEKDAFYLPPRHSLIFNSSMQDLSTGQFVHKSISELMKKAKTPILLLDEWDANLDNRNRNQISDLIDLISKEICVLEVRHGIGGDSFHQSGNNI